MLTHNVSIPNAKDITSFAEEYQAQQAAHRLEKRRQIMQKRPPLRPTLYGIFILGLAVGALITTLIAFVMRVSGVTNGITLIVGIALALGAIGAHLGDKE